MFGVLDLHFEKCVGLFVDNGADHFYEFFFHMICRRIGVRPAMLRCSQYRGPDLRSTLVDG